MDAPSNFLLLFLSPFSPPNWPKAPAPKNCHFRQRFCVGAYKIWSHRGAKSGHEMNVTRICTSNYLRTFGVIFHHTAHVTSRLKIQIQRLLAWYGTNYFVATQPKRWSCSLILTTMHLYTPNYLLIRLLVAERSSLLPIWCGDFNMHTYHHEMQVTMATSNFLVNRPLHYYYLLLTSKPRTPISVLNVLLEAVEKTHRWTHKTQVSSRCFWAALSTSPAADSMWYVDWRCCVSPRSQNILRTDVEYITQLSFVEMMTAATIVSHFELWRGV